MPGSPRPYQSPYQAIQHQKTTPSLALGIDDTSIELPVLRPRKRRNGPEAVEDGLETADPSPSARKKNSIACQACRERKTRCFGFPICSHCSKSGIDCTFISGEVVTPLDIWGARILDAIKEQRSNAPSANNGTDQYSSFTFLSSGPQIHPNCSSDHEFNYIQLAQQISPQNKNNLLLGNLDEPITHYLRGINPILTWPSLQDKFQNFGQNFDPQTPSGSESRDTSNISGNITRSNLMRLRGIFAATCFEAFKVIDLNETVHLMSTVAENGATWSTSSCLVLLVSALASLYDIDISNSDAPAAKSMNERGLQLKIAYRYWNMAKKRLAWALEEDSLRSAQCLSLAGLWYLHFVDRRNAWKSFRASVLCMSALPGDVSRTAIGLELLEICRELELKLHIDLELELNAIKSIAGDTIPGSGKNRETAFVSGSDPSNYQRFAGERSSLHTAVYDILRLQRQSSNLIALVSGCTSWQETLIYLSRLSRLRMQLQKWIDELPISLLQLTTSSETADENSHNQSNLLNLRSLYQETRLQILSPYLYICQSTCMMALLSDSMSPMDLTGRLSAEIRALANECLAESSTYLQQHLRKIQHGAGAFHFAMSWSFHRTAMTSSLLLLVGCHARAKARNGAVEFGQCAELVLPIGWISAVEEETSELLNFGAGTPLWQWGRILQIVYNEVLPNPPSA